MKLTSRMLAGALTLVAASAAESVTPAERQQALQYLNDSSNGVVEAVKGLSDAQWNFKPGPDRWSIAEVVEHLALIEGIVTQNVLAKIETAPAGSADRDIKQVDATLLARVEDRTTKFKAPPAAVPTGRWTPPEALDHYLAGRAKTVALLKTTPDLRQHVIDHPVLGTLDGYEWVLAVAGHTVRHTKQILEVKADPNFPAN